MYKESDRIRWSNVSVWQELLFPKREVRFVWTSFPEKGGPTLKYRRHVELKIGENP